MSAHNKDNKIKNNKMLDSALHNNSPAPALPPSTDNLNNQTTIANTHSKGKVRWVSGRNNSDNVYEIKQQQWSDKRRSVSQEYRVISFTIKCGEYKT